MFRSYRVRLPRGSPHLRRYQQLPQFIRTSHFTRSRQNPNSLLALAYRALHRPYTPPNAIVLARRNANRRRIQPRVAIRRSPYYRS